MILTAACEVVKTLVTVTFLAPKWILIEHKAVAMTVDNARYMDDTAKKATKIKTWILYSRVHSQHQHQFSI